MSPVSVLADALKRKRARGALGGKPIVAATFDEALLGPAVLLALTAGNVVPARAALPPGVVDRVGVAMGCAPRQYRVFLYDRRLPRLDDGDPGAEHEYTGRRDTPDPPDRVGQGQGGRPALAA